MPDYRSVQVVAGPGGWGGPITVEPTEDRPLIYSVTGGGIHPVAQRIAELTGGEPFDGFRSSAKFEKIAVAVIDCGGTARVGVYPMKKVKTIDVHPASPAGPLAQFITEELFVSGVGNDQVELAS
jgi:sorbitol-specific phosphotransferase system component IIBC